MKITHVVASSFDAGFTNMCGQNWGESKSSSISSSVAVQSSGGEAGGVVSAAHTKIVASNYSD